MILTLQEEAEILRNRLKALEAKAAQSAKSHRVAAKPTPVTHSAKAWIRARNAEVKVYIHTINQKLTLRFMRQGALTSGRPSLVYELKLGADLYRAHIVPADKDGAPIAVLCQGALPSDFSVKG